MRVYKNVIIMLVYECESLILIDALLRLKNTYGRKTDGAKDKS